MPTESRIHFVDCSEIESIEHGMLLLRHIGGVVVRLCTSLVLVGTARARAHTHQMRMTVLGLQLLHHHLL